MILNADPFADITLDCSSEFIIERIASVTRSINTADKEQVAALSLQYLGFLNRILAEIEASPGEHRGLEWLRSHRTAMEKAFGEAMAETRTTAIN